ncbi:hypothetical protein BOX15_Mlig010054g1 [Macrostomum lignano]|uniref:Follistatin-related protein 5 n=2 Tax=Macrostomum lignano TaxID=282301 RepID=A0A267F7M7_9PLAT|nr:hypothetical protein BOX15_Mlig010054g1 [Macrostomum lignano]
MTCDSKSGPLPLLILIITIIVSAQCETGNPCDNAVCKPGRVCRQNDVENSTSCVCAPVGFCRRRHRRPKAVCGSDGRRYPSHCELHRTACVTGRKLRPLPATACLAYDARLKTPTAEMETSTELTDQNNCNSHQVSVLLKQLRFDLMKRQCQDAGKTLEGCLDYSARSKDAELIMDRIFARLDTNSNGRVTKFELAKKFAKPDPCFNLVVNQLLGKAEDGANREMLGNALDLPETTAAGSRQNLSTSATGGWLTLTCPLGLLGPFESITWTRRSIEIQSISNRSQDEGQVSITGMARQMDSGVYKCCSSLWPRLCASVALAAVVPPYIRVQPSMLVRREGDSAQLHCKIVGGSQEDRGLRWLFKNSPIKLDGEVSIKLTETGSVLSIRKLGHRHTGMYTCRAENAAGVTEFAATIYVRSPTETDYSSYPLSLPAGAASAVVFHAGGISTIEAADCAVRSAVSADFDDVTLCENLVSCAWGRAPVLAGSHVMFAAQPSLGRLLALQTSRWLTFEPVQLNCPPSLMAYRQQTDQLWVACGTGGIFVVDSASAFSTNVDVGLSRRRTARRWRFNDVDSVKAEKLRRVLRLPDSRSTVLVALIDDVNDVEVVVIDVGDYRQQLEVDGGSMVLARVGLPRTVSVDTADLLVQGGTLLLHKSTVNKSSATLGQSEPTIIAIDLRTGARVERHLFPQVYARPNDEEGIAAVAPTGRIFVSNDQRHVMHISGSNVYVYEVFPTGELSLTLHDVAGVAIRSAQFQATPDGGLKILARTERDGAVLVVDLKAHVFQLVFDEKLDNKPSVSAPEFGNLALVHSHDSAVFFNTTSLAVTECSESLFVGLQSVHWLEN